jgi:hypothetical protein
MTVKKDTALVSQKISVGPSALEKKARGEAAYSARCKSIREVISKMTEAAAWDHIQARDVPMEIIDFVAEKIHRGVSPGQITKELGLNPAGGKNSKQWRKIQAYFRQGFRADAEAYLIQQSHDYYRILQKTKETLEDAFEHGAPIVNEEGSVIHVKGATKELAGFIETYSRAVQTLPKLWKDFGAISESGGKGGAAGPGGVTIVVKTNVPSPPQADVDAYRKRMLDLQKPVIDVTPGKPDDDQS